MPSLYELSMEMQVLQRMLEEDDSVDEESFTRAINQLNIEMGAKIANIGLLVLNMRADIEQRNKAIDRLKDLNDSTERKIDRLKKYALDHMREPVKTPLVSVRVQKGRDILFVDPGHEPEEYLVPQPPRLDKVRLLKDLKEGKEVLHASIAKGDDFVVIR